MNQSIIILFIFMVGIGMGYSLHESKDKIEIHNEANKIFQEYQGTYMKTQFIDYNVTNISRIDLP